MSDKVIRCPQLSLSYALKVLANTLRDSPLLNGLKIGGLFVKISVFADDTLIFLNGLENQFEYVFNNFQAFGRISGCKLNLDKFEACYIGSNIREMIIDGPLLS